MAIQHGFKSAYAGAEQAKLQGIGTITEGVKDTLTTLGGALAGFGMGAAIKGGSGALSTFGTSMPGQMLFQSMAGKLGGVGGHVMAAQMREKLHSAMDQKSKAATIKSFGAKVQEAQGDNPIYRAANLQYTTVYEKMFGGKKE